MLFSLTQISIHAEATDVDAARIQPIFDSQEAAFQASFPRLQCAVHSDRRPLSVEVGLEQTTLLYSGPIRHVYIVHLIVAHCVGPLQVLQQARG